MKLPLVHKTTSGNRLPTSPKCKHKIATPECEIQGSIEIQMDNTPLPVYLITYFLLSWLPFLLILLFVHNSMAEKMEIQKLEVDSLTRYVSALNAEVDSMKNTLLSFKGHQSYKNQKFAAKNREDENFSNDLGIGTMFTRRKRSVDSGFLAIHLKGAHPENVVEAGHVGPWFVDSKAIKESKISSSFRLREDNESVEIETAGLYFIYAQVYYLTSHALNSFTIMVLPKDSDNPITLAYCSSNAVSSNSTSEVSCFTGVMYTLQVGDRIYVQQREKHRRLIMRSGHSFLGLVKFSGV